ncbi:MAG: hypothetical protein U0263_28945 [Polyangiaceae bacterium]
MCPRFAHFAWLSVLTTLLAFTGPAGSEPQPKPKAPPSPPPSVRFPAEQPVAISARVALLEQKVHAVEQRLKAFEKVGLSATTGGGYELTANGARVSISRDGTVSVTSAPPPPRTGVDDPCDPPFSVDPKGFRSIKPECLQVGPCEPPFTVDREGRRTPKKECL